MYGEDRASAFEDELTALQAIKAQPLSALPHLENHNRDGRLLLTSPIIRSLGESAREEVEDGGLPPTMHACKHSSFICRAAGC